MRRPDSFSPLPSSPALPLPRSRPAPQFYEPATDSLFYVCGYQLVLCAISLALMTILDLMAQVDDLTPQGDDERVDSQALQIAVSTCLLATNFVIVGTVAGVMRGGKVEPGSEAEGEAAAQGDAAGGAVQDAGKRSENADETGGKAAGEQGAKRTRGEDGGEVGEGASGEGGPAAPGAVEAIKGMKAEAARKSSLAARKVAPGSVLMAKAKVKKGAVAPTLELGPLKGAKANWYEEESAAAMAEQQPSPAADAPGSEQWSADLSAPESLSVTMALTKAGEDYARAMEAHGYGQADHRAAHAEARVRALEEEVAKLRADLAAEKGLAAEERAEEDSSGADDDSPRRHGDIDRSRWMGYDDDGDPRYQVVAEQYEAAMRPQYEAAMRARQQQKIGVTMEGEEESSKPPWAGRGGAEDGGTRGGGGGGAGGGGGGGGGEVKRIQLGNVRVKTQDELVQEAQMGWRP